MMKYCNTFSKNLRCFHNVGDALLQVNNFMLNAQSEGHGEEALRCQRFSKYLFDLFGALRHSQLNFVLKWPGTYFE